MGKVPQPNIQWRGAHPNNFTVGRPGGGRNGQQTDHHVVGSAESAVAVFNQGTRGASAHLIITDRADVAAFQCVSFDDTAWSDGNWASNLRTISIEHHGDWRNGYRNEQVIANAAKVVAWLRDAGLVTYFIRHRDVKPDTQCCADLPCEEIWDKATAIIQSYNKPAEQPEWLKNRKAAGGTVYAQNDGLRIYDLANPANFADSRVFARNTSFEIGSETTVGGVKYLITRSSTDLNKPNGIRASDVAAVPYTPPQDPPTKPETPRWQDSLVDEENRKMYALRETFLIDLERGIPVVGKDGNEVKFRAGDVINDVSAHTIVAGKTYYLTEYSFSKKIGNGILASDLSLSPESTPPGTPANPDPTPVFDFAWLRTALEAVRAAIQAIIDKLPKVGGK